ncbi:aryl-sulfate sulfotransferase [Anaeromicropila populeti]|uniref:Arylsulfotransferase (ASST) n=1 Tax=Anaeromicropila populeti TaxID=37658 RepID=A0A1I6KK27_9FIRM|nr:aryl-sulfate sulfotransferase [Anaeromicropila populeti]SFR91514.1 Arylsulfotransferase (ASST) [Anaeromicropila populeti]
MKKIVTTILITSIIMAGILFGTLTLLTNNKKEDTGKKREELDLLLPEDEKEIINAAAAKPLSMGKKDSDILLLKEKSIKEIYKVETSETVKKRLEQLKKQEEYSAENPLMVWNPFGTNDLSLYLYLKSSELCYLKYTIQVEDAEIPDFNRILLNGEEGNLTRKHEYQLVGFVPGYVNYLTLRMYNANGNLIDKITYSFKVDKLEMNIPVKLAKTNGESEELISNGLFFIMGMDASGDDSPNAIPAYDNSGVLRSVIPLKGYRSDRLEVIDGQLLYSFSKQDFAMVSAIGQVMKVYHMNNYELHHDFIYNGYGQLWMLTSSTSSKAETVEDYVVSLDLDTGKVKKLVDLKKLFPKVKKKANKPKGEDRLDWIHLNSLTQIGSSDIIISSRELSSIIKINNITSIKPTVGYIIADPVLWEDSGYEDLLLKKGSYEGDSWVNLETDSADQETADVFTSQFGQHSVTYQPGYNLEDEQYYLSMFNNNFGRWSTRKSFDWSIMEGIGTDKKEAEHSYYYKYMVDESAGYYGLIKSIEVPYSNIVSNVQDSNKNYVINSGKKLIFGEYDKNGVLISQFMTKGTTYNYRVFKYDMKNIWFY